jgi:hypothetical protein
MRDVWGAVWRAQVVHLALYAGVPLLLESARAIVFVLFLPLTVMGVGEKRGLYEGTLDHLAPPICWQFVSARRSPDSEPRAPTATEMQACVRPGRCEAHPVYYADPLGWTWKFAWAALSVLWIVRWRYRQRR